MSVERWIRLIAGTFIVLSVSLSYFQSRYWLWFTLFVGVNLFQSALTRWCLMEDILRKLGVGGEAGHARSPLGRRARGLEGGAMPRLAHSADLGRVVCRRCARER